MDKDPDKSLKKDLTNADYPKRRKRSLLEREALLDKRTPPPSSSDYDGYTFSFDWTGAKGGCRYDCSDAYRQIEGACSDRVMLTEGSLNVDCGSYHYSIASPSPTPTTTSTPPPVGTTLAATAPTKPKACYQNQNVCHYNDVKPSNAHSKSDTFCDDHASQNGFNGPGWPAIQDASNPFFDNVSYNWKVLWKPDCVVEGHETLNVGQPIPEFSCKDAMRMVFDQCNNGGRGGRVEVGCLEYYYHNTGGGDDNWNCRPFRPPI